MKQPTAAANKPLMRAMQDLRKSSAAQPHRNRKRYTRKTKHRNREKEQS